MKQINHFLFLLVLLSGTSILRAQTNTFPTSGNVGIGTLSPTKTLQVTGSTQLGGKKNNVFINSGGILSFNGSGVYQVDSGQYVFQNSANTNYGLFFGQSNLRYEFRDQNAAALFFVRTDNGNGYFSGRLGIGKQNPSSKLDVNGDINISSGSVLKMNGATILRSDGIYNLFVGESAGILNTGQYNNAVGYQALYLNTTGGYNTATGYAALFRNTTGIDNTATGIAALVNNTTGGSNTGSGVYSLYETTTGYSNTANGAFALNVNTTGSGNTADGSNADVNGVNYSNNTALGYYALGTASNQVRLGNSSVTSIGGYANWTNISDGRVKKNIKENVPGLEFINQLKPVTYNLDLDKADNIVQRPVIKDSSRNSGMDESKMLQEQNASRMAKEQVVYTGFVAQDVEKVAKSLNYDFSGVDAPKNDKDLYGLRYAEFVVPLVKAVQELSKANDDKDAKIDDLQKQLNDLKNLVLQQSSTNGFSQSPSKQIGLSSASLEQNIPNPFSNVTSISYFLPTQISSAKIIVTDKTGKTLKEISLNGGGKGTIQIDASTLSGGAYQYSLFVNNKLIDTKQMVSVK